MSYRIFKINGWTNLVFFIFLLYTIVYNPFDGNENADIIFLTGLLIYFAVQVVFIVNYRKMTNSSIILYFLLMIPFGLMSYYYLFSILFGNNTWTEISEQLIIILLLPLFFYFLLYWTMIYYIDIKNGIYASNIASPIFHHFNIVSFGTSVLLFGNYAVFISLGIDLNSNGPQNVFTNFLAIFPFLSIIRVVLDPLFLFFFYINYTRPRSFIRSNFAKIVETSDEVLWPQQTDY